jgi:hypothetical protein
VDVGQLMQVKSVVHRGLAALSVDHPVDRLLDLLQGEAGLFGDASG